MARPQIHLETIRIDGFRSCDRTAFSPRQDLSVLIGPNGSGKTNILQGIALLASWLSPAAAHAERAGGNSASDSRVTAAFRVGTKHLAVRSTVRFSVNEDNPEVVVGLKDEWRAGGLTGSSAHGWVEVPFPLLLGPREAAQYVGHSRSGKGPSDIPLTMPLMKFYSEHGTAAQRIVVFRHRIRYYSASQFTDPTQCPSAIEIDQDGALVGSAKTGRAHRQFLLDLYQLKANDPPKYASYISLVGKQGLQLLSSIQWKHVMVASSQVDVRTGGKAVKQRRKRVILIPSVTHHSDRLSFNQLSEGTFKSLALVFYLITDTSDLLLLEEPEVGVHHGLLVSLVELIKGQSRNRQIIVSTHSDFVLDHVEPENVFSVTCSARGKTSVRALADGYSPKQLAALRDYLRTDGNLGDYWRQFGLES